MTCPCGVTFSRRVGETQRYCSRPCWLRRYNSEDPDGHGRRGGLKGGAANGARLRDERGTDWYLKVGGRHVHRVVAERLLGRPLAPGEIVHHEDRNKLNNEPENLFVFPSQAEHARHHSRGHCGLETCDCRVIRLKGGDAEMKLHPYQIEGAKFLQRNDRAALFMEMGLG